MPMIAPPSALKRVLVVSSKFKPEAHDLARDLARTLERRGAEAPLDLAGDGDLERAAEGAQLVFAVGGDGTILSAARRLAGAPVPTVGINIGRLGFLAEFTEEEVRAWLDGGPDPFNVLPRLMLRCRVAGRTERFFALNDAVI